jgi:predicted RecA/RadA family phage recombinase
MSLNTYEAQFMYGPQQMVDYTPGSAVDAGDVVVQSSLVGVALRAIDASAKGGLAITGVFLCAKGTGSGKALSAGTLVYWDDTNNVVTSTASTHKQFGYVVTAAGADAATVEVAKWSA